MKPKMLHLEEVVTYRPTLLQILYSVLWTAECGEILTMPHMIWPQHPVDFTYAKSPSDTELACFHCGDLGSDRTETQPLKTVTEA